MNESLWTFGFEIANFVALAALLAWLFFNPVRRALADQQTKLRKQEETAKQTLEEAERMRQDVEAQRAALADDLDATRNQVLEIAKQEAEQIRTEARAQADRERAAVKQDALHIEQAQIAKLAKVVASTTHSTMKRFLQQMDGPELEQTLLRAACRELNTLATNSLAPVTIESAAPLGDDAKRLIQSSLGDAAKSVDFRVVPELEGGLRIATGHGLIDASVTGLANFAEQSLFTKMESIIREEAGCE